MIKVIATGSTGNSYLIEANPNERLLIECGIPYKRILEGLDYNISGIQGCLISHEHKDHMNISTLKRIHELRPTVRFLAGFWLKRYLDMSKKKKSNSDN